MPLPLGHSCLLAGRKRQPTFVYLNSTYRSPFLAYTLCNCVVQGLGGWACATRHAPNLPKPHYLRATGTGW